MYMVGPLFWRIAFRIFVVLVGFLILSGAINTSMIGSTGVLMRVAEDGVLTDWFRKPHPRFGTSYRIINLVFILQMFTIIATPGQHHHAGRGVCLRRHLVIHLQQPGHAGAALEVPWRTRLEGSSEHSHRQDRDSDRPAFCLPGAAVHRDRQPVHQVDCDGERHHLRGRASSSSSASPSARTCASMP